MYSYGTRSTTMLSTVHPDLRAVAHKVMSWQVFDLAIICGYRGKEAQLRAFMLGNSTKKFPFSTHNTVDENNMPCSNALDFAPWVYLPSGKWGIPWNDTHAFAVLGGMFVAAGAALDTPIVYGGDWDMDGNTKDQTLMDWGHAEILNK